MSILPTVAPHSLRLTSPRTPRTLRTFSRDQSHTPYPEDKPRVPVLFKRLLKFSQMDFELAAWQLTYLCVAPRRVYKNVYFHKQTKNTWARDDPAILWLVSAALCVSAVAWGLVYSFSPFEIIKLALLMVIRDFVLSGAVVATIVWGFSNTLLLSPSQSPPTKVEWAYTFDVHTNAFFPVFLILHGLQLVLLPVVSRDGWVWMWMGNSVWVVGLTMYVYVTYLGLNALPFLIRTELLLFPLLPLFAAYAVSLLGFNIARWALQVYFGS
ncbi:Protein unc-50 homolog OS=Homo sapiens GN=UNC50 PE=1 SV=2 [Rhizoctonia solani AG-1 IB]|uniref:Protein unc-50 homolog n=1 Tax=Thanatephorus cucumeris (strain AG1-IB / isolate 7/3/14) TaxID=1108050 RepID=A0A0B7FXW3_THACB|nr:Protein unc-50 homolog OS=Homo sapiens GN=UNC50 PE=1 SV=2 [Rhizoctonia solani AG-1 IB]